MSSHLYPEVFGRLLRVTPSRYRLQWQGTGATPARARQLPC
jgi:hypothetical protein